MNPLSYNAAFGQIEFTNKVDFDEGDLKLSSNSQAYVSPRVSHVVA